MIKAIVYDWDDTLVNTFGAAGQMLEFARGLGFEATMDDMRKHWGKPWDVFVNAVWPEADLEQFTQAWRPLIRRVRYPVIEGAIDVLANNNGYVQGVFTGRDRESLYMRMKSAGFKPEWFKFIETLDESGVHTKENPDSFRIVIERLESYGIRPDETVFVDDSIYGSSTPYGSI